MSLETKQDLLGLIRKEAGIAYDVRDAAAEVAKTADRLCRAIGTKALKGDELRAATNAHCAARSALNEQFLRLIEHSDAMNEAAE